MCWITYTDRNMTEFLTYDRTKEVVVVDPLFIALRESMKIKPTPIVTEVEFKKLTLKQFNSAYLSKNVPVKVKNMAADWNATKYWDFSYL
jgi:hypothetical protein